MIVNISARFALLSIPKSASTSMDKTLMKHSHIIFRGFPAIKHLTYRKFIHLMSPLLIHAKMDRKDFEIVCIMREPAQWLSSVYRYRGRPNLANPNHKAHNIYTGKMTFEQFLESRFSWEVGEVNSNQLRFLVDSAGNIGVDRLFRLEDGDWKDYFSQRIGKTLEFPHVNVTRGKKVEIPDLRSRLPLHYELYDELTATGEIPHRFRTLSSRTGYPTRRRQPRLEYPKL